MEKRIPSPYLTSEEAASYLRIAPRTLRNWKQRRVIPHRKVRGKVLYKIDELDAAMDRYRIHGVGEN